MSEELIYDLLKKEDGGLSLKGIANKLYNGDRAMAKQFCFKLRDKYPDVEKFVWLDGTDAYRIKEKKTPPGPPKEEKGKSEETPEKQGEPHKERENKQEPSKPKNSKKGETTPEMKTEYDRIYHLIRRHKIELPEGERMLMSERIEWMKNKLKKLGISTIKGYRKNREDILIMDDDLRREYQRLRKRLKVKGIKIGRDQTMSAKDRIEWMREKLGETKKPEDPEEKEPVDNTIIEFRKKIAELEQKIIARNTQIKDKNDQIDRLKHGLANEKDTIKARDLEIQDYRKSLNDLQNDRAELQKALDSAAKQIATWVKTADPQIIEKWKVQDPLKVEISVDVKFRLG